jgi:hypothetical protein
MKLSRLSQNLIVILPIVSILASAGIVVQQTARHDRLEKELAASDREYDTLENRYLELTKAPGSKKPAAAPQRHEHHDGDGD